MGNKERSKMKLNEEIVSEIHNMLKSGESSRDIAKSLGISKSSVNNYRNASIKCKTPKILFIDLESAGDIALSFTRFNANLSQENILQDGGWILSIAWAFNDEPVKSMVLTPEQAKNQDDKSLVCKLSELIEQSDYICGHNIRKFDYKLFLARCAVHGFSGPRKVQIIDTLTMARKMRFQSNKLGSLAKALGCSSKLETGGIRLWVGAMFGDKFALQNMREYNEGDVITQREVYYKLRAFGNGVNLGVYYDDGDIHCPVCGSTHIESTGNTVVTNLSVFLELECKECGNKSRTRQAVNSKEHRSLQLQS